MRLQRHSIRLPGYDYSQGGMYFVTLCCQNRQHRFGSVSDGVMHLNEFGQAAHDLWYQRLDQLQLPTQHPMQIMPNHLHGIIELPLRNRAGANPAPAFGNANGNNVGATLAVARNGVVDRAGASPAPTLGDVVGAYKSMLMQICLDLCRERQETLGRFWQRNYYEHIIRDELSYTQICSYIECNPIHWQTDEHFSA